jgi:hypothetical protein
MFKKFTAFDQIPKEKQKDAVELKDGTFATSEVPDDVAALQTSVTTLETTVKALRREKETAETTARTATETAADLQRKLDAKEATGQQTDAKITEMLAKWQKDTEAAVAAAVADKDKQITALSERVTKYDLDDVLGAAFKEAGGREDRRAKAVAQAKLEGWTLVDGRAVRKDSAGQVLTTTTKDFFTGDFKKDVPEWYEGSKADGGGGDGGSGGTGDAFKSGGLPSPTKMTSEQRRAFIDQNGAAAYTAALNAELAASTTTSEKK